MKRGRLTEARVKPQRRWLAATLATSLAFASVPGMAVARETDTTDEARQEAESLIDRGIALRKTGADAEALPLFQQAEQLDPESTRVKVHLAATYQALGQWEAADRYLTRALERPTDPYVQKHQATLATARRTVDGHIGQLRVLGGPRGTEVRLNGRSVGTLPIDETLRVEAGIYTLEARLSGHYPVTRSVALAGGVLVRETLELEPLSAREEHAAARADGPAPAPQVEESRTNWWAWTFGGLAMASGVVAVGAWATREQHADTWNDDEECLAPGQSRESQCGSELDKGKKAENVMWISGGAAVLFSAAALGSVWLEPSRRESPTDAGLHCGIGLALVQCAGRF
jgi:tetratricopeptide (TPR) repeat protein